MSEIKPALTAAEWESGKRFPLERDAAGNLEVTLADWISDGPGEDEYEVVIGRVLDGADRHALAALALHGRPFGFTHDDVDRLRAAADVSELDEDALLVGQEPSHPWMRDLADRLAALLPPREP